MFYANFDNLKMPQTPVWNNMMRERDLLFMSQALELAREALQRGEVPVGAVVVDPYGTVIGSGGNRVEELQSQTEHAEACALRNAGQCQQNWRLEGCTLYVTLEPCMMCVSLAALSRIERIVYGASSPRYGFSLDREGVLRLYTRQIKSIEAGVGMPEAAALLEDSFNLIRERHDDKSGNH